MTEMMTVAETQPVPPTERGSVTTEVYDSTLSLFGWLERNDYRGYDTFDGLSAKYLSPLTFGNKYMRIALQQGVRRFPLNLRPLLGIDKGHSTKGMGFLARGFIRLHKTTGDPVWAEKAKFCLQWLIDHQVPGYSGACWGNHFDYQSRTGSIPKGMPTVVWTSLIGHAFLDGYEYFGNDDYRQIAISVCEHIIRDLRTQADGEGLCINYTPGKDSWVHNANTLGGGFLARAYALTKNEEYRALAQKAMQYTAQYQRADGSWYYGEKSNLHWVDNFHTGYVLDCFKHYTENTGDNRFNGILTKGYNFWKQTFFLKDGTPKYYDHKTLPLDIQCSSQAIDTLVFFSDRDPDSVRLALAVARWTIANMQDKSGYFYYRRYSPWIVNKTPTLHWGQATMFCALAGLYKQLSSQKRPA
jgi:polysaccharide biosynthesis protein VpsJ